MILNEILHSVEGNMDGEGARGTPGLRRGTRCADGPCRPSRSHMGRGGAQGSMARIGGISPPLPIVTTPPPGGIGGVVPPPSSSLCPHEAGME